MSAHVQEDTWGQGTLVLPGVSAASITPPDLPLCPGSLSSTHKFSKATKV